MKLVNETYIVRVYRRGKSHGELTGLVETIGKDERDRFNPKNGCWPRMNTNKH